MVNSVCCIINGLIIKLYYRSFVGKLLVYVLAPLRFPVLQVFPGLPDNPGVIKAIVMLKRLVFPSTGESSFYFVTAVTILTKTTKQPKIWSHIHGKGFLSMGNVHVAHLWGYSAPKVHLNPTDSHKPMYYKLNNDHHRNLLPLIDILGKVQHGEPITPENIIISNHNAVIVSLLQSARVAL